MVPRKMRPAFMMLYDSDREREREGMTKEAYSAHTTGIYADAIQMKFRINLYDLNIIYFLISRFKNQNLNMDGYVKKTMENSIDGILMYIHRQYFKSTCLCHKCITRRASGNYCVESMYNALCTILAIVTWFLYCENDNSLGLVLNDIFFAFRFDVVHDIITKEDAFYYSEAYKDSLSKMSYCDLVWQHKAISFKRMFRDLPGGPVKRIEETIKSMIENKKKMVPLEMRMPLIHFFFNEVVIKHQIVHELYYYIATMSKGCD